MLDGLGHPRLHLPRTIAAQILNQNAGELISEVVTHMEYGDSAEDLDRHVVKVAGLATSKSNIHALQRQWLHFERAWFRSR